jgi:hypothetical protein
VAARPRCTGEHRESSLNLLTAGAPAAQPPVEGDFQGTDRRRSLAPGLQVFAA